MNYLDIYGREEEFELKGTKEYDGNTLVNSVFDLINTKFKERCFSGYHRHFLFTGGAVYNDGGEPEICTPPCLEKKGFVEDIVNATIAQRLLLFKALKRSRKYKEGTNLVGYSSHENISFNDKNIPENMEKISTPLSGNHDIFSNVLYSSIYRTIGPMMLLFFKNYESSYGINCDHKDYPGYRIQLRCEYNPDIDQLRAGIAFLYGSVRGIEKKIIENFDPDNPKKIESLFYKIFPFSFKAVTSKNYEKYFKQYGKISVRRLKLDRPFIYISGFSDRIDFNSYFFKDETTSIKDNGSETKLTIFEKGREKEINLTDALKEYIDFFKDEIRYVSDDKTWDVLQEFAEGKRKFQMDEKKLPEFYRLNKGDIDKYIKRLIGNKNPYQYLEEFKPQEEFQFMGNIAKKDGKIKYEQKNMQLNMKIKDLYWDHVDLESSLDNSKKYNHVYNSQSHSYINQSYFRVNRDYFAYFNYLLNESKLNLEKKFEIINFVGSLEILLGKRENIFAKNYEFLKNYIQYKENSVENNNKRSSIERGYIDLINIFERKIKYLNIALPTLKRLNKIEECILRDRK